MSLLGLGGRPPVPACAQGTEGLTSALAAWTDLVRASEGTGDAFFRDARPLVRRTFAPEVIARRAYDGNWSRLDEDRRARFGAAVERRLALEMRAYLADAREPPQLTPVDQETVRDGDIERIPFLLVGEGVISRSVWVAAQGEGPCRIADLRGGGGELIKDLRERVKKVRGDYSFAQMVADVGDYDYVVLEDFEDDEPGGLPRDWTWRGGDKDKNKPYEVVREGPNQFLKATDRGESVILGREVRWNTEEYPYVSFRVRVWKVPEGGDERYDDLVDSAAGIYFTLNKKVFGKIPESVKYVWSSTLPVGAAVRREGIGKPWQVVFGTGTEGLGEWRTYVFDIRQAYRDTFGGNPPKRAAGIGVLSDANSLHVEAFADYDDIRALRTAPAGVTSGVDEIMAPLGRSSGGR